MRLLSCPEVSSFHRLLRPESPGLLSPRLDGGLVPRGTAVDGPARFREAPTLDPLTYGVARLTSEPFGDL